MDLTNGNHRYPRDFNLFLIISISFAEREGSFFIDLEETKSLRI
jgi:hypothetical protein